MLDAVTSETTIQAMHVLLDMVVSYDEQFSEAENMRALRLATARLTEVDAISATRDDETETTTLNMTPLLVAAMSTIDSLARVQAHRTGADRLAVLATLREHMERALGDPGI